jgi:hypothetical protein
MTFVPALVSLMLAGSPVWHHHSLDATPTPQFWVSPKPIRPHATVDLKLVTDDGVRLTHYVVSRCRAIYAGDSVITEISVCEPGADPLHVRYVAWSGEHQIDFGWRVR